jgi:hypothetical protein
VLLLLCVARKEEEEEEEEEEGDGITFFFFFVLWNCCSTAASLHGAERLQRCSKLQAPELATTLQTLSLVVRANHWTPMVATL